jgi:putative heme-binding domain-containing protein
LIALGFHFCSYRGKYIHMSQRTLLLFVALTPILWVELSAAPPKKANTKQTLVQDPEFQKYGIYEKTAPRATIGEPQVTLLPLKLQPGERIAFIGNVLLERMQLFGHFEAMLHQRFPEHRLTVRNLAWPADEITLQPRPENFADLEQHLTHEQADVVFMAFGFNESFAGDAGLEKFRQQLTEFVAKMKSKQFNGKSTPRLVLIAPIANENVASVSAADMNNARLEKYIAAMEGVAVEQKIGFANLFESTRQAMSSPGEDLTVNGIHLNAKGYELFSAALFKEVFRESAPAVKETIRAMVVEKDRQYMRRYRPLNTFYYTGGRKGQYGYLDFLPAMRNFDLMVRNRDERIWKLAQGQPVPDKIDDSNVPELPKVDETRGVNEWLPADQELQAFQIDPRFEVNLFAGEEQFPEIANPIQMRWDSRGRLWVSCSSTYPHVYPGKESRDRLVILEDTNQDGRADKSTLFADDLHIPLSFEFGDGGVYVSEQPSLTFLKDTNGDDKADIHEIVLTGFGTEDSHHALHDFAWTPDGDLIFRESIFHHSQVETPYGPVRQQNSGWFRFSPHNQRLISFGTYPSTNPWGVTFDDWGQHMASHPIYAAAFHALDPPYPQQHPAPQGLRAYSGTCGQEFVDFATFPPEMRGNFIKARYKPTNRIEIHRWNEQAFGYDEEYVGDLIFSTNLSFIPVDVRFGPRGDLYICDWYNPVKGHAQYSLRDERRDRHSGRIWRVTAKGRPLQPMPKFATATIPELLELLKRPESRYREWAKRELRTRERLEVKTALDRWVQTLDAKEPRYRHHQLEALWTYRWLHESNVALLRDLLACDEYHARAAATQQLRYWHDKFPDSIALLRRSANDAQALVRMEAAIAASYIGTQPALDALLEVAKHPREGHLDYAFKCALGSHTMRSIWEGNSAYNVAKLIKPSRRESAFAEPKPNPSEAQFDKAKDLKTVKISCLPERMLFTVTHFTVRPQQPVKLVFSNPDATDHNLVIVQPDKLAEVGMAANEMAKDRANANSDFIPPTKQKLILHASPMIGPTRKSLVHVLRFSAPEKPGVYPYVCTFPGHWIVMNGVMIVAHDAAEAEALLAASKPVVVKQWTMADFTGAVKVSREEQAIVQGMQAFVKARCNQCHVIAGHGVNLGPDLTESIKKYKGEQLLRQILEPSQEIHEKFRNYQFELTSGRLVSGTLLKETPSEYQVLTNMLLPQNVTSLLKTEVEEKIALKVSPMPEGMVNVLTREEILDLLAFLEAGNQLPAHLQHQHHQHP